MVLNIHSRVEGAMAEDIGGFYETWDGRVGEDQGGEGGQVWDFQPLHRT